jgi:hypothetical protein
MLVAEDLVWCLIVERLVEALFVVKSDPAADAGFSLRNAGVGLEVDLLVLEAAPQPLHEDVVQVAALAVHADPYSGRIQDLHEAGGSFEIIVLGWLGFGDGL